MVAAESGFVFLVFLLPEALLGGRRAGSDRERVWGRLTLGYLSLPGCLRQVGRTWSWSRLGSVVQIWTDWAIHIRLYVILSTNFQ